jgi:hypothetical protein
VKGQNKRSEKTLHIRQLMGDRRCCPERQMLLCSICRHILARGFGPGVGEPSDAVSRERQTRPGTLFQRLSLERVERGVASRVRRVSRLRTGRVYRPGALQATLDRICRPRGASVVASAEQGVLDRVCWCDRRAPA